jgi:hypothetical protein
MASLNLIAEAIELKEFVDELRIANRDAQGIPDHLWERMTALMEGRAELAVCTGTRSESGVCYVAFGPSQEAMSVLANLRALAPCSKIS